MFKSPVFLSLRNRQLVITFKDNKDEVTRPIEDIGFLVIENPQVSFTVPLLNELADNNVSVIFCDKNKMPKSMLMCLDGNNTLQESYRYQVEASSPTKKRLWQQLIECKIRNQATLLDHAGKNGNLLKPYYMNVRSGDTDNREGAAARIYWGLLFDNSFKREREGSPPNNLLNYGYTVLRATAARALVGSGLYPAFGIFHKNRYNAFPLADDIMEPYRPFVDEITYQLYTNQSIIELDTNAKNALQRVLFSDVKIGGVTKPLELSLSMTTSSMQKVFKGESDKLSLPFMI